MDGCDVFEKDHFGSDELLKDFVKNGHDASCCAGVTPSKHAAAIEVMRSCQIEIKGEE